MQQLSELKPYLPTLDPYIQQLQELITKHALEPDHLSQSVADIKHYLLIHKEDNLADKVQALIARLHGVLPRVVQPALLLAQQQDNLPPETSLLKLLQDLEAITKQLPPEFNYLIGLLIKIQEIYKRALTTWQQASEQERINLLIPKPQLTGTSLGFYYLPVDLARELICRDAYNFQKKANSSGNHAVVGKGGVHYKPMPFGSLQGLSISPGYEYALYSFHTILGGPNLAAQTTIVKISNVPINKIIKENQLNQQAYNDFSHAISIGQQADQILSSNPVLANSLTITPAIIERVIQAGQTIEGMSLEQLLALIEEYNWLKVQLKDNFSEMQLLINSQYLEEYLVKSAPFKYGKADADFTTKFMLALKLLPAIFSDFKDQLNSCQEEVPFKIKQAVAKYSQAQIIKALAIVSKWPQLAERGFHEIIELIKIIELIPKHFASYTIQELDQELPNLLNKIDSYNLSALYAITLFTNPSDAKADNFMVVLIRNPLTNKIENILIVGIDNDKAFNFNLVQTRPGKHYAGLKSVILFLLRNKILDPRFRQHFLSRPPELFMAQWLRLLYLQNQRYERLIQLGVVTNEDLVDPNTDTSTLDIPLKLEPSALSSIFNKITRMYQLFHSRSDTLILSDMVTYIDPVLAEYYQELNKQYPEPLKAIKQVYSGKSVEEILETKLDTDVEGKSYRQLLEEITAKECDYEHNRNQSLEEAIKSQFIEKLDFSKLTRDLAAQLLKVIAQSFPFVDHLPMTQTELNEWFLYAVHNNQAELIALMLRAGADVNCFDSKGNTALHWAVSLPSPSFSTIKVLLGNKKINPNAYNTAGQPPIFCCYNNIKLIELLVQAGADLEARSQREDITLLDYMVKLNKPNEFVALVDKGAGIKVNADLTYPFIKKYRLSQALEKLTKRNPKIAWLGGLDVIFLANSNNHAVPANLSIYGMYAGSRVINNEVLNQIYDEQGNLRRPNRYGRHAIPHIKHMGQQTRLKFRPELPNVEIGLPPLCELLFEKLLSPQSELFRFPDIKGKGKIPVLVSNHLEGNNLQEIFNDNAKFAEFESKMSMRSFTMLLILIMLTNPADGKPDQFILVPILNEKGEVEYFELHFVDGEQSFVKPVTKEKGKRVLGVKSVIYCLNQMLKVLDKKTIDEFLNKDIRKVLEKWLLILCTQQKLSDGMFTAEERKQLFEAKEDPVIMRFPFTKGMAASIYEKAILMQTVLKAEPSITGIGLLRKVIPSLGIAYAEMFRKWDNPASRFQDLHKHQYSKIVTDVVPYTTVITGKQLLQTQKIPDKEMITAESEYTPNAALAELRIMNDEKDRLREVRSSLLAGNIEPYKKLLLDSSKESVLLEVNLGELPLDLQLKIFKALEKTSLKKLNLSKCDIDDKLLEKILSGSPNLTELNVTNCKKLTVKAVALIADNCPLVRKLVMNETRLQAFRGEREAPAEFSQLEYLQLNKCENLEIIQLRAPQLTVVWLNGCSKLTKINIDSPKVEQLSHEGPSSLAPEQVERFIAQSPALLKNPKHTKTPALAIKPHVIARLLSNLQNPSLWTEQSLNLIMDGDAIDTNGLRLSREQLAIILQLIAIKKEQIHHLILRGTHAPLHGVMSVLRSTSSIESLAIPDHRTLPKKSLHTISEQNLVTCEVGLRGELYTSTYEKPFFKWRLSNGQSKWELTTPTKLKQQFHGHEKSVTVIAELANGDIVTGSGDRTIRVWNSLTHECLMTLKGHSGLITALCSIGQILVSASQDKTLRQWNLTTGECIKTTAVDPDVIKSIEPISSSSYVTGSDAGKLCYWEISGKCSKELTLGFPINKVKLVAKNLIATAHTDNRIRIWNTETGNLRRVLEGHKGPVNTLLLLQEDGLLASGSEDANIFFWDLLTGEKVGELSGHSLGICTLSLLPTGDILSASSDGLIQVWPFKAFRLDLKYLTQCKQALTIQKDGESIKMTCSDQGVLAFCQQLINLTIGFSGIKINGNQMQICQEKYQRVSELLSLVNSLLVRNLPTFWQVKKPSPQPESPSTISRHGSPIQRASALRQSDGRSEPRSWISSSSSSPLSRSSSGNSDRKFPAALSARSTVSNDQEPAAQPSSFKNGAL